MKTVMVTGADRGLGYALCERILSCGWKVAAGRYMPDWKQLDDLEKQYPENLYIVPLDVGNDQSVKAAVKRVEDFTPSLDILINCAGIDGKIRDIRSGYDYESMLRTLNINALGAIRMTEACLTLLDKGQDKKICCISSEAGSIGTCWRTDETEYCMSKAALNAGMAVLDNRLKKDGYDIRLYHPGWMNTYMMGVKEEHADLDPEAAADLALNSFLKDRERDAIVLESYDGTIIPW